MTAFKKWKRRQRYAEPQPT